MAKKTYGQRLREWREGEGLTQLACAEKIGVTQATWSDWESDKSTPRSQNIVGVQRLTGGRCSLEHLAA